MSGVVGFAGATGYNPSESTARMFIQLKPFNERAGRAGGDRTAEAEDRPVAGREILHAGRPGRDRRRPAGTGAVPVHADRQRRGGTEPLGADPAATDAGHEAVDRRCVGPADRLAEHRRSTVDRNAAYRLGLSMGQIDQTLYDAFGEGAGGDGLYGYLAAQGDFGGAAAVPGRSVGAVAYLRGVGLGRAGAAVGGRALHLHGAAADGEPSGRVPRGDAVVQPGARRGAGPGGGRDPGDAGARCTCRRRCTARSRARRRRSSRRCPPRRCWSPRRSWSSTSCWACSTRASSTRSPSCPRCRPPASARC